MQKITYNDQDILQLYREQPIMRLGCIMLINTTAAYMLKVFATDVLCNWLTVGIVLHSLLINNYLNATSKQNKIKSLILPWQHRYVTQITFY